MQIRQIPCLHLELQTRISYESRGFVFNLTLLSVYFTISMYKTWLVKHFVPLGWNCSSESILPVHRRRWRLGQVFNWLRNRNGSTRHRFIYGLSVIFHWLWLRCSWYSFSVNLPGSYHRQRVHWYCFSKHYNTWWKWQCTSFSAKWIYFFCDKHFVRWNWHWECWGNW